MQLEIAILLFIHAQFALKADSAFFIGMLSPPEDTKSRDVGALDEAGRERYLNSLERRLGKLEGSGGKRKQLTSKDILQSLSEAKDDYMQQQSGMGTGGYRNGPVVSLPQRNIGGGNTTRVTSSGRGSPFSIKNEFADVDLGGGGESLGYTDDRDSRREERSLREEWGHRMAVDEGEERPISNNSIWSCCLRCRGGRRHRVGYSRARRSRDEAGEEGSNLVDYDELSLEWQSQDINDVT